MISERMSKASDLTMVPLWTVAETSVSTLPYSSKFTYLTVIKPVVPSCRIAMGTPIPVPSCSKQMPPPQIHGKQSYLRFLKPGSARSKPPRVCKLSTKPQSKYLHMFQTPVHLPQKYGQDSAESVLGTRASVIKQTQKVEFAVPAPDRSSFR